MVLNFSLTLRERGLRLLRDELGGLAEDGATLGVAEDHVGDLGVGELGGADFAGEGARILEVAVLRGEVDLLRDVLVILRKTCGTQGRPEVRRKEGVANIPCAASAGGGGGTEQAAQRRHLGSAVSTRVFRYEQCGIERLH